MHPGKFQIPVLRHWVWQASGRSGTECVRPCGFPSNSDREAKNRGSLATHAGPSETACFFGFPLTLDVVSSFVRFAPFYATYHMEGLKNEPRIQGLASRGSCRREPLRRSTWSASQQRRFVIRATMRGGHHAKRCIDSCPHTASFTGWCGSRNRCGD